MVVRELVTRFGFNVDQAGISKVEGSINRLSGLLSGIAAFASLRALAKVGDSMQSLEARIGMLPQTIGNVGEAFNEVARHASDNRQSIEAYGSFYTKVGNAAKGLIKDQSKLLQITDTISQALVVGGANTMEAQSAMLQFGQALGSGVLQGDEFRSMAEAAPQYLDALAEAMGHPREQLKKMASDGKLTSKAVIEATLKMSTLFEDKFRKMPLTIGQATTIIGNKFSTMIAGLNRESKIITSIANFILDGFIKIEGGAKSFIEFVGGATNALKTFGIALAAILGPMALGGLITALGAIFSIGGLVVASLFLLGLAIDDVISYLNGGNSAFGDFLQKMQSGSIAAQAFGAVIIGVIGGIAAKMTWLGFISALTWSANSAGAVASFAIASAASVQSTALMAMGFIRVGALAGLAYANIAAASLAAGVKMASAWLLALGPIGLVIAGIAAVTAAMMYLYKNWENVKGFFSGLTGIGQTAVAPSSVASANSGKVVNMDNRTNVSVTVPSGTPESQATFLKDTARQAYSDMSAEKMARDMAVAL